MSKQVKTSLILGVICLLFLLTRLINLTSLPVFGDEAIYVRWSQIIKSVDTLRFIPLTDGKQPLFMWLNAVTLRFFADPLVSGRLISVMAGLGTTLLLYFISGSLLPSLLYLFLPLAFFFDRLATADNLLSFFGLFSLYLSIKLSQHPRWDLSMLLGAVLGLAWLTKSPAIYFIVLSLTTFLFLNPKNIKKIYFPLLSALIAFIIYNLLRLGPQFSQIALRNLDYVWSLTEILKHPFDPLIPHLRDTLSIFSYYLSWPLLLSPVFYLFFRQKIKFDRTFPLYLAWFLLPLIANAAIAKVYTARYILFTLPPLLLLFSYFLKPLFTKKYFWLLILLFIPNLWRISQISFQPRDQKLPSTESGYVFDWTSGWGIKEASDYLILRSKEANVIVGTEGYFGTLPDGLQIYTNNISHLTVFGVGINITEIPEKLIDAKNYGDEVYLLFNSSRLKLSSIDIAKLTLVKSVPKPDGDALLLYRL